MTRLREILEILYYLSGPIIAYLAFRGLKQITVSKDNARLMAKRESYKIAVERCDYFLTRITPIADNLYTLIAEKNIKLFTESKLDIKIDTVNVKLIYDENDRAKIKDKDTMKVILDALNSFESLSVFFTSGVASEEIAFPAIGRSYCSSVKVLLPIIAYINAKNEFPNINKLFFIWSNRIEKQKLLEQKQSIEKQLSTPKEVKITPIGLEQ